jgi:glycine betaine catabolism A
MSLMLERSLPRSAYLDQQIWHAEQQRIFAEGWVCIGRHSQVDSATGSYRLIDLQGERVLVVRGNDGALRAFANMCRHRGAELVDSTDASACSGAFGAVIRCPYHHWTYNIDGSLRGAPYLTDLDRDTHGLIQMGLEIWGGFVFIRQVVDEAGTSLLDDLGPGIERIANYPLGELVVSHSITYEVGANWKVLAENYNECYHCGPVHPELCDLVPAFRHGGGSDLDWEHGIPHRPDAYTFTASGTTTRQPFVGLNEHELVNHKGELFYPNLLVSLSCDHVAAFTLWPTGPAHTRVVCDFLFHPDQVAAANFDPSDAVDFWDVVNRQDWAICERVQRGMTSRHFTRGLYSPMEDPSLDIRRWWTSRMGTAQ